MSKDHTFSKHFPVLQWIKRLHKKDKEVCCFRLKNTMCAILRGLADYWLTVYLQLRYHTRHYRNNGPHGKRWQMV